MKKRVNMFIGNDEWAELKALAAKKGGTVSEHIRRAVDFYLALCDVSRDEVRGPRAIWNTTVMDEIPFAEPPISTRDNGHLVYDGD